MEYRKAILANFINLKAKLGDNLSYDNSTDVDNFWNTLNSTLSNVYGSKASIGDTESTVSLNPYTSFSFLKTDSGIEFKRTMPFFVVTQDSDVVKGIDTKALYPKITINDSFDKLAIPVSFSVQKNDFKTIVERDSEIAVHMIAWEIFYERTKYLFYDDSNKSLSASAKISITKDELKTRMKAYGYSDEDVDSSLPSGTAEIEIDGTFSIALNTAKVNNAYIGYSYSFSLSFYDDYVVINPKYRKAIGNVFIATGSTVSYRHVLTFKDSSGNSLGQAILESEKTSDFHYNNKTYYCFLDKSSKTITDFGLLKPFINAYLMTATQKASNTEPKYIVDNIPDNIYVGQTVVVFNEDNFEFKKITAFDATQKTVTFDSYTSFADKDFWISNDIPSSVNFSVTTSSFESSNIRGFTINYPYQQSITYSSTATPNTSDTDTFYVNVAFKVQVLNKEYELFSSTSGKRLNDYLDALNNIVLPLSKTYILPLVKDGIYENYLDNITFKAEFNQPSIEACPLYIYFKNKDTGTKDYLGKITNIIVVDKQVLKKFPEKGFIISQEEINVSRVANLVSKIYNDDKVAMFLVGSHIVSDRKFFEVG